MSNIFTTIDKLDSLKRLQARIKAVQEECERLCREIEEINPFVQYYQDADQAYYFDLDFHEKQLPWLAWTELEWLITQLDTERERLRQEFLATLPTEDIPF